MKFWKRLSFLWLLFPPLLWAGGQKDQFFSFNDFRGGLNSNYSSLTIKDNEVQDALNVYFDKDNSVGKRRGYTLYGSTAGVSYAGMWSFVDSTNNYWLIVRSSDSIRASPGNGSFTVQIATVPSVVTSRINAVSAFGKIYFVDNVQGVYSWDGTSTAYISGSPKGTFITEFHGRLWVAGLSTPNQNFLYASGYLDGTTWTTGTLATSPVQYQVGLNDRADGITAFWPGYNDTLYVFKNLSINSVTGFDQTDFTIRTLSKEAGCIDQGSLQAYKGYLFFISQRGLEQFDGSFPVRISSKIKNLIDPLTQSSFNNRTFLGSGQAYFNTGTITTANSLSTSITPGSLVLSTQVAPSPFTDTSQANFQAGTLTNTDATTTVGSVILSTTGGETTESSYLPGNSNGQPFLAGTGRQIRPPLYDYRLSSIVLPIITAGSPTTSLTISIKSDSSGSPGTTLGSSVISAATYIAVGNGLLTVSFSPAISLTKGTLYWIYGTGGGTDGTAYVAWWDATFNDNTFSPYRRQINGGTIAGSTTLQYKTNGLTYNSTGNLVSRAFDMGFTTSTWTWSWGNFQSNFSQPSGSTITFQTQTSADASTWEALQSASTGTAITSTIQRYIRYKANFAGGATSPQLDDVTITPSSLVRTTGSFKSAAINTGTAINSFGSFQPTQDITTGGSIAYSLCTSPNSNMIPSACANQTANAQITVATNAWTQVYSTFTITSQSQNPSLSAFVINWNEGNPRPYMSSVVYDDRYWLAASTASSDSFNDAVIVMYMNEGTPIFTKFDIKAGALALFKGSLYHADSQATGNVYLEDIGYNDNGTAISAYITTKDYAPGGLIQDKYYESVYVIADALGNYNLSTNYMIDRNPTLSFALSNITQNEQTGMINVNLPFPFDSTHQKFGKIISFKFSNSTVNQPMNIYGGTLVYRDRASLGNLNAQ